MQDKLIPTCCFYTSKYISDGGDDDEDNTSKTYTIGDSKRHRVFK